MCIFLSIQKPNLTTCNWSILEHHSLLLGGNLHFNSFSKNDILLNQSSTFINIKKHLEQSYKCLAEA